MPAAVLIFGGSIFGASAAAQTTERWVSWTRQSTDNASFSSDCLTGTVSLKNKTNWKANAGILGTTNNSGAANFPGSWFTPTPSTASTQWLEFNANNESAASEGFVDVDITFKQPVKDPKFHFVNLDNAKVDFGSTTTTNGGSVSVNYVSGNNTNTGRRFEVDGATVNNEPKPADKSGCQNLGNNPNGACGTVRLSGIYTKVTFRVTDTNKSVGSGDGFNFTISRSEVEVFTKRFEAKANGDVFLVGNTLMTCSNGPDTGASCNMTRTDCSTAQSTINYGQQNGSYCMKYVNVDDGVTGIDSASSADLALPVNSTVRFAGLYWGGYSSSAPGRTQVKLKAPGGAYEDISGTLLGNSGSDYAAFADVTTRVQNAGAGTYTVANILSTEGSNKYAGWALVTAVEIPQEPTRFLAVFDGYTTISSGSTDVYVPGLTTPTTGTIQTHVGVVAFEGDGSATGDRLKLNFQDLGNDPYNPTNNFFNSSITKDNSLFQSKNPNYTNQLGIDVDRVDATGKLGSGDSCATISFSTNNDRYFPAVAAFSTELYAPNITVEKSFVDSNGNNVNGSAVAPGETLAITLTVKNSGLDSALVTTLFDEIPTGTTYKAASLNIVSGANAGPMTDRAGDDEAEYDTGNNRVVFRLGSGAGTTAGGTLATNASTEVSFQVTVDPGLASGTTISNSATVDYTAETLGTALSTSSDVEHVTVFVSRTAACTPGKDVATSISGVVNKYYAATADADAGSTSVTVDGTLTDLSAGDEVLVIQMQDAEINSTDTASYGDGQPILPAIGATDLVSTGLYEYACVQSTSSNTMTLVSGLLNSYHGTGGSTFQVVRVPQYQSVTLSDDLTADPWNGKKGGIVVIDVAGEFDFSGHKIDVDQLGFRGAPEDTKGSVSASVEEAFVTTNDKLGGSKGEGTAGTPQGLSNGSGYPAGDFARGAPGSAGGGGNQSNAGGGGGANCGTGGWGGATWNSTDPVGGFGGAGVKDSGRRLFLGGGGGAGHAENNGSEPGGAGGGIAILNATRASGSGAVTANGGSVARDPNGGDGNSGGGGGGTILLSVGSGSLVGVQADAKGGKGGDALGHGPGGGGGGGVIVGSLPRAQGWSVVGGDPGIADEATSGTNFATNGLDGAIGSFTSPPVCVGFPEFEKSFAPNPLTAGQVSTLTFTIDNSASSKSYGSLSFTDPLPNPIVIAGTPSPTTNDCGGGTVDASPGASSITFSGGSVSGNSTCTITVPVTTSTPGEYTNTTGLLTSGSTRLGTASAKLTVTLTPPTFSKSFSPNPIHEGGVATLAYAIDNRVAVEIGSLAFTDTLPSGVVLAADRPRSTCGGNLVATAGESTVTFSGGTLSASGECLVLVKVTSSTAGAYLSTSGDLTSAAGNSGPASATLSVSRTAACTPGKDAATTISGTVNSYYPATADAAAGSTSITVRDTPSDLSAGDQVLVIQMQDAEINSTNTETYGDGQPGLPASGVTDLGSTGLFEYACVEGISTDTITLTSGLSNTYHGTGGSTFQVVRVPQYSSVTLSGDLTAPAWDGRKGGVVVIDVANELDFDGHTIDVDRIGFRGAPADTHGGNSVDVVSDFVTTDSTIAASKGEGIAGTPQALANGGGYPVADFARGAPGTAGGGGNQSNSGGGGGANCGFGGLGGTPYNSTDPVGGFGGAGVRDSGTRLLLGGGGGAGQANNNASKAGGSGGGIAIVSASRVSGSGTVTADGGSVEDAAGDGNSGGGGGGSILLSIASGSLTGIQATAQGGHGGTVNYHGPGGGGGGGVIISSLPHPQGWSVSGGEHGVSADRDRDPQSGLPGAIGTFSSQPVCGGLPSFTKSFDPLLIDRGAVSTLTFTIDNTHSSVEFDGLDFDDTLETPLEVAAPANVSSSGCGSGSVTANSGESSIDFSGGTVAANGTCTISVDVTSSTLGTYPNTTGLLTSTNWGRLGTAAAPAPLVVKEPPGFSKTFLPGTINLNETAKLTFTIDNSGNPVAAGNLSFTDDLPAGLKVASTPNPGGTCAGILTAAAGAQTISWSAASLDAGDVCTIEVDVVGDSAGTLTNISEDLTSSLGNSGPATSSLTVHNRVALSLDKTSSPDSVLAGSGDGNLVYTITVRNNGPSPATGLTLSEHLTLPAGVTIDSITPSGSTTYSPPASSPNGTWTVGNLGVHASATLTVSLTVGPSTAPGTDVISDTVAVTRVNEPDGGLPSKTVSTSVTASADLGIAKSSSPAVAGSNLTYTVEVTNGGPSDARNVVVTDTLPGDVTLVSTNGCAEDPNGVPSCTLGTIAAGSTQSYTIEVTVDPSARGVLTNRASVTSDTPDPGPRANTTNEDTSVRARVDLTLSKGESIDPVEAGSGTGNLTYTLTVGNQGPSQATGLELTEALTLPSGVTVDSITPSASTTYAPPEAKNGVWTVGSLDPNVTATLTVVLTADATTAPGTDVISDTLTVTALNESNNTGATSVHKATSVEASANLAVDLSASPDPVVAGNRLTYTVRVTNAGPSDARRVVVTDTLPGGVSHVSTSGCAGPVGVPRCALGTIAAGSSKSFTVTVRVDPSTRGTLTNTVRVSSDTPDPDSDHDSASVDTTVDAEVDLTLHKTGSIDPVVAGSGPGNLRYTITVGNSGPSQATGLELSESLTLPSGVTIDSITPSFGTSYAPADASDGNWTVGTLDPGASAVLTVVLTAGASTSPGTDVISDTVTVTAVAETNDGDSSITAATSVAVLAALGITLSDTPDPVLAGRDLTYTVEVTNGGPSEARDVVVTDRLPGGVTLVSTSGCEGGGSGVPSCALGTIAAGSSKSYTITVTVDPSTRGKLTDHAGVTSATPDPDPDNSTSVQTTVHAQVDLTLAKQESIDPVVAGSGDDNLTYTFTVGNDGPSQATGLSLTEALTLPPGVTVDSITPGRGTTYAPRNDPHGTWTVGSLDPNTTATLKVELTAGASMLPGTDVISDTLSVASVTEPNDGAGSTREATSVAASADLAISLSASPDPVVAGNQLTYTVQVRNNGPSDARRVVVTDTLPGGVSHVSTSGCAGPVGVPRCALGTIAAGSSKSFTVTVRVDPSTRGELTNTVRVSSETPDPDSGHDSASVTTRVVAKVDLTLHKTGSIDPVVAGSGPGNLRYTITVDNSGPSQATGLELSESLTLPSGVTIDSITPSSATSYAPADASDGTWTVGTLDPGASAVLTVVLTAGASTSPGTDVISDTVTVTAVAETNDGDSSTTAATSVAALADLGIYLSDSPDPVLAGRDLTYTVEVTNAGPSDARDVVVTDTLPGGVTLVSTSGCEGAGAGVPSCALGTIAAGSSKSYTNTVKVEPSTRGVLTDTASVTSGTPDPDIFDNAASAETTVHALVDLTLAKKESIDPVVAGSGAGNLTYTFTVGNDGPSRATGLSLTEALTLPSDVTVDSIKASPGTSYSPSNDPNGTWTVGSLAPNATATLTVQLTVGASTVPGTHVISDTLTVVGPNEPNHGASAISEATSVVAHTDLSIAKVGAPDPVVAGTRLTYTLTVTNHGPSDSTGSTVTDNLPAGVQLVSSDHGCSESDGTVTCGVGALGVGATASPSFVVKVDPARTESLTNTATVAARETDPDSSNDSSTEVTAVDTRADLSVTVQESRDPVAAGHHLSYQVTVTNHGPSVATGTELAEALPAGVTFNQMRPCTNDPNGVPTCDLGTLGVGATVVVGVRVTVDSSTPSGDITNTVKVSSDVTDPNTANNTATATTLVDAVPPTVKRVDTPHPTDGDHDLAECEEARVAIRRLYVEFSEAMWDPPGNDGSTDVTNPANYLLVGAGGDEDFSTSTCSGGVLGDDVSISIDNVTYFSKARTASIVVNGRHPLGNSLYRLLVCGSTSVKDVAGNRLNGGKDFVRTFRVERTNLFRNGHFDCNIDSWSVQPKADVTFSRTDVDGSGVSGSAHLVNKAAKDKVSISQCVPVTSGKTYTVDGRLQLHKARSGVSVSKVCSFYRSADCSGKKLRTDADATNVTKSSIWTHLRTVVTAPASSTSVQCTVELHNEAGARFEAFIDDLSLVPSSK